MLPAKPTSKTRFRKRSPVHPIHAVTAGFKTLACGLLAIVAVAQSAEDHEAPALTPEQKVAMGFEGPGWTGLEFASEGAKEGAKLAVWKNHTASKSAVSEALPRDWSGFAEIRFQMFSKKANGAMLLVILDSRKDPKVFSYYMASVKVDWEGWREVVLPLRKFKSSRNPVGWNKIDKVTLSVDGWDAKADSTSEWMLDGMTFTPGTPGGEVKHTKLEMKADMARIKEIAALLPPKPSPVLLVPASDRARWATLDTNKAAQMVARGESCLKNGIPPFDEEAYLAYTKVGKRTGDSMMGRRTGFLGDLVLAECVEYKGRFIPMIGEMVESIAKDPSWTLSAHDSKLDNFSGRKIEIDLSVAARALQFSAALKLLEGKLPQATVATLRKELERHVFEPYRKRFTEGSDQFWWMSGDNNWNAVCHAGVVLAALSVIEDPMDRALFINGAERGVPNFLNGMPDDGYCTEGIGYWGYGFGNYVLLSMGIHQATGGKIDWFKNTKVAAIGRFGRRMELMNETYPAYADCGPVAKPSAWIVYLMDRLYQPEAVPAWDKNQIPTSGNDPQSMCETLLPGTFYNACKPVEGRPPTGDSKLRDYFDLAGVINCRPANPAAPDAFAVSLKGGHNAEEHNHNDLGSYVVSTPNARPPLILDPGNEVYTSRTFSSRRYESRALSSFGHGVPLIDGKEQRPGRDAEAKRLDYKLDPAGDELTEDLTSAYDEVSGLKSLVRRFVYTRTPACSLRVEDTLKADRAMTFGTAVMTYEKWQATGPNTFVVYDENDALQVAIEAAGQPFTIKAETIEEDMGFRRKPTRIGINLTNPAKEVTFALVITRIDRRVLGGGKASQEGRADRLGLHRADPSKAITVKGADFTAETGGKVEKVTKVAATGQVIKGWDHEGHILTYTFSKVPAGTYAIQIRYCNESMVQRLVLLDGKPFGVGTNQFDFNGTGGWSGEKDDWKTVTLCSPSGALRVNLAAGNHTLTLVGLGGGMNLDTLSLVPASGKNAINVNPLLLDAEGDGAPKGWEWGPKPGTKTTATWKKAGDRGEITLVDADKENGVGLQQVVPVLAGKTYRQSALLGGDGCGVYFNWLDKNKKQLGSEVSKGMKGGKDQMVPFTWDEKAPEGAAFVKMWYYLSRGGTGDCRIAEPCLEEVSP